MKAKEYLLDKGRISEIGRGRISNENHAFLAKAAESGIQFSDWPKGKVVVTEATDETPEVVRVKRDPNMTNEKVIHEIVYTYPENLYRAVDTRTGKEVGMREVCNTCRVSLVGHACDRPTILGDIPVAVKPRG